MASGGSGDPSPRVLAFLNRLVDPAAAQQQEKTDSDKENEAGLMTIAEEEPATDSDDRPRPLSVKRNGDSAPGEGGAGFNSGNSASSDLNNKKNEEDKMWDDFYNDEEFTAKKDIPSPSDIEVPSWAKYSVSDDRTRDNEEGGGGGEVDEEEDEDEEEEDNSKSQGAGDEMAGSEDASASPRSRATKRKRKRLFRKTARPPPPSGSSPPTVTGGSHPDLGRPERERHTGHQMETMSESSGRGGRRLSRRKQVARPRVAGPEPDGDRLQQKYQELRHLMVKPLVTPAAAQVQQTRQQLRRLHGLSSQYGAVAHTTAHNSSNSSLPPAGGATHSRDRPPRQAFVELGQGNTENGYATIRTVQLTNKVGGVTTTTNRAGGMTTTTTTNRPSTAHAHTRSNSNNSNSNRRPQSGTRRPASATTAARREEEPSTSDAGRRLTRAAADRNSDRLGKNGGGKVVRSDSDRSTSDSFRNSVRSEDYSKNEASSDGEERLRSGSRSPGRAVQPSDTHLKNSSNPALRKWLKQKDKEHRRQKAEERKKKREERTQKQMQENKKQEHLEKAEQRVKEWMSKKRREAYRQAKEDRRRRRAEAEEEEKRRQMQPDYSNIFRARSAERPKTDDGEQTGGALSGGEGSVAPAEPPKSKFVYKRPVSGRVRLMKLQQERKEDARRSEKEKRETEKKMEEEKAKKMRMSYDQWLLRKREENYAKRQESARQKAMARSDPELERIVPEVARRRIDNIKNGRKRVDTGIRKINDEVNKSFGGADYGADKSDNEETQTTNFLEVSGAQKSLRQRPSSAKHAQNNGLMNPMISKSPRRPKSANPRVQALKEADGDGKKSEKNAFRLPFPPEKGVPRHVDSRQKKLFSAILTEDSGSTANDESVEIGQETDVSQDTSMAVEASDVTAAKSRESEDDNEVRDEQKAERDGNLGETGGENLQGESGDNTADDGDAADDGDDNGDDGNEKAAKDDQNEAFFVTEGNLEGAGGGNDGEGDNKETSEDVSAEEQVATSEETETSGEAETAQQLGEGAEATDEGKEEGDNGGISQDLGVGEEEVLENKGDNIPSSVEGEEQIETPSQHNDDETAEDREEKAEGATSVEASQDDRTNLSLNLDQEEEEEVEEGEIQFEEENEGGEQKEGMDDEAFFDGKRSESRGPSKHVSFQEETEIYEPVDLSFDKGDEDEDEDEAEDERGDHFDTPRDDDEF
ncbi:trichohyalin [Aplysia californica]|uniref:Trichohyalin n=1 Tax=Aplysia californica TaxID=6500 RepID=A0ABM1W4T4_APLCA|nr:trichohyalin [Aplysia californica]XP_035829677.1 trichohyalin [Aplysia californica]